MMRCLKNCTTSDGCKHCLESSSIFTAVSGFCSACLIRLSVCITQNCAEPCLRSTDSKKCEDCAKRFECNLGECTNPNCLKRNCLDVPEETSPSLGMSKVHMEIRQYKSTKVLV